jgi:multidrug efflux pump subunit AcrB
MGDGRERRQAAIEAVAEVGNPTIVATLTVVAALLPMLFVSGMMGPYMSPIPANASAAMIFSFFVAVTVTPWLMLKVAGRAPVAAHDHHAEGGKLGRIYAAVARPVLRTKARSWLFLGIVGALTLGSLSLFYTQHVTVKLLPFDNKSELSVVIDLPEGASVEATDAVAQDVAGEVLALPEVRSAQVAAGTAAPFNFNGLVRHSYLRAMPEQGDRQQQPAVPQQRGQRRRSADATREVPLTGMSRRRAAVPRARGTCRRSGEARLARSHRPASGRGCVRALGRGDVLRGPGQLLRAAAGARLARARR